MVSPKDAKAYERLLLRKLARLIATYGDRNVSTVDFRRIVRDTTIEVSDG